ncbi:beta-lactamase family protein [Quadrisphaera sp. RL12-1S]|nr:serine hydrolase domain-containing protein [Quadrisphaera sp. RL12-1S]MBC3762421.1 beta-lactamase family protein [Quadrisphaera sp. RL12-1S]
MLLDRLEELGVECHSLVVVRRGRVVAEGWWTPYAPERPHLLYSLTKSFTATAVGLAVQDGLLHLEDRVVDLLPDSVPAAASPRARRLTVRHLLTMTAGHAADSLEDAWALEPADLARGFLRVPFDEEPGSRHVYDNATTYVLARLVERVTGTSLPELLDQRLFRPMGVRRAEWDRLESGEVFGFHGLHLTTEAVAAFGELLLREGRWGGQELVAADWIRAATSCQVPTVQPAEDPLAVDSGCGYGYQFWKSRSGFRGYGAYEQLCLVYPEHDLVVAMTAGDGPSGAAPGAVHDCLLPQLDAPVDHEDDDERALHLRLAELAFPVACGSGPDGRSVVAGVDATPRGSALTEGTTVEIHPEGSGWGVRLGRSTTVLVGHGRWSESAPLGRPVVASGAWHGGTWSADLFVITSPHRVRLTVDAERGTATAVWNTVPLTSPDLLAHVTDPLVTRRGVS